MNKLRFIIFYSLVILSIVSCRGEKREKYKVKTQTDKNGFTYETVLNDPLNARIYTLPNGLKVYLSVYKDAPRIQTYIAVKAGSKNDPANATGLAHYLEHILFKGTSTIGTTDWEKEKVMLKRIESLYEKYRQTKDSSTRKFIYHRIDSVSGEAAKLAIANEYDKMVGLIGAQGTNAYTSVEQTVYVNDIPSNQLEKWAFIESNRFSEVVPRLFHTELEAVYEEKNRGLDNDRTKVWESIMSGLFKNHTYGTQTTIGTVDHLQNPSIKEIKKFFKTYYVPNNIAICMSGDLVPEDAIVLINKYFGKLKSKEIPKFTPPVEAAITSPVVKEIYGPDAEKIALAFRFPGTNSREALVMDLISKILTNGQAGLIDLNLNQQQRLLGGMASPVRLKDYSLLYMAGSPRENQTLEEVKKLLLAQLDSIKEGRFDEGLLKAIIYDTKISQMHEYESNENRADAFVTSFTDEIPWPRYITEIDELSSITKAEIMEFAKNNFKENYVLVNKHTGIDKTIQKVIKPKITPVTVNREAQSRFFKEMTNKKSSKIEPVYVDFSKDLTKGKIKEGIDYLYKKNTENELFSLYYVLEMGNNNDPKIALAARYLDYLGTSKMNSEQLQKEFYKIGCSYDVSASEDKIFVSLSGLNENFDKGVALLERLLADPKADAKAYTDLVDGIMKERANKKLNKGAILQGALLSYAKYGKKSPYTNIISEQNLRSINPEELTAIIKKIFTYKHRINYYGPLGESDFSAKIAKLHDTVEPLLNCPAVVKFEELPITETKVYWVNYEMVQAEMIYLTQSSVYNKELVPKVELFNQYFGGDMSSIVFQEIRESKALAYAVKSKYSLANEKGKHNYVFSYIGTQADKLPEAMGAMDELFANLPESKSAIENAKNSILNSIETDRITKDGVLGAYEAYKKLGLETDIRKDVYEYTKTASFNDVKQFHANFIKNQPKVVLVIGSEKKLNMEALSKYGKVEKLTLEEIFGY